MTPKITDPTTLLEQADQKNFQLTYLVTVDTGIRCDGDLAIYQLRCHVLLEFQYQFLWVHNDFKFRLMSLLII